MHGYLELEEGTKMPGVSFGDTRATNGEVVFSTGMVGYPESLTDPSYAGQILVYTYPLVGSYGVPDQAYWESNKIQARALIVSSYIDTPSHITSTRTLSAWLKEEGIPALQITDTRFLAQKIRTQGVMKGKIVFDRDIEFEDPNSRNLVAEVSTKEVMHYEMQNTDLMNQEKNHSRPDERSEYRIGNPATVDSRFQPLSLMKSELRPASRGNDKKSAHDKQKTVVLIDCGVKNNTIRHFVRRGLKVIRVPWDFDPFAAGLQFDGLFISNGPGDPKTVISTVHTVKKAIAAKVPTFGICLGNQILALAAGGDTYKLKYGHRGQNQPCYMEGTARCYLTTQNHGYAVGEIPKGFKPWFTNANDGTNEGIIHTKLPFFSVQFHPEAFPGPVDTEWIFDYFMKKL